MIILELCHLSCMSHILLKDESFQVIGICMQIHRTLGMGFKEAVYKDALEIEFKEAGIPYQKEKQYRIEYKGKVLAHNYFADFVVFDELLLEIKSTSSIIDQHLAQTINYLKASGLKLGIIANFGERSFTYKRVVF